MSIYLNFYFILKDGLVCQEGGFVILQNKILHLE